MYLFGNDEAARSQPSKAIITEVLVLQTTLNSNGICCSEYGAGVLRRNAIYVYVNG